VLFWLTGVSKNSFVNILAREKLAHTAPDMRCRLLQCTEAIDLDDKTSVKIVRFEDLNLGMLECLILPRMGARCVVLRCSSYHSLSNRNSRNKHELIVLFWQTGVGKRLLIHLMTREEVAPAPDMRRRIQYSETVDSDNKNSKVFSRIEDPHLSIRGYQIPPNIGARCVVFRCSPYCSCLI
jgi:hypothetical protein